ncbi:hypothetical protein HMI01_11300 [Halolactibacillus miurensis]|uniref:Uncharacterized protein n=1 Tax=Halolactibacillus miurensis TaxID=306541 RepID=A0A1I6SGC5_9BACI|nr:hypothetical protein [Halolactibacillus miurensis]GEM04142.1 hypothetical protein HMI01_11300 [Halolactibacillus miurensis]SFS75788.1 hypothetical protein SAMN05421668_10913 [Halolactibacillus miurensis]
MNKSEKNLNTINNLAEQLETEVDALIQEAKESSETYGDAKKYLMNLSWSYRYNHTRSRVNELIINLANKKLDEEIATLKLK